MAVGYIFQNKSLAGSCGGLATMGIDKACDCDDPCAKRIERDKLTAAKENQIDIKNMEGVTAMFAITYTLGRN